MHDLLAPLMIGRSRAFGIGVALTVLVGACSDKTAVSVNEPRETSRDIESRSVEAILGDLEAWNPDSGPVVDLSLVEELLVSNEAVPARRTRLENLQTALTILSPRASPASRIELILGAGIEQRNLGAIEDALSSAHKALELARRHELRESEAQALNNIGLALRDSGNAWEALDHLQQARAIYRQAGNALYEAIALHNIGLSYNRLDRPVDALRYLERALVVLPDSARIDRAAPMLTEMARVHLRSKRFQPALEAAQSALELRALAGKPLGRAATLDALGTIYWQSGDFPSALEAYREALEIYVDLGDTRYESDILANLGRLYESRGDVERALDFSGRALAGFRDAKNPKGIAHALYISALAELRRDRLETARQHMEEVLEINDSWRRGPELPPEFYATRHIYFEIYIEILMCLHERDPEAGYDELAFGASERGRGRGLLAELEKSQTTLAQIAPDLLDQRDALIYGVNALQRRLESLERMGSSSSSIQLQRRKISDRLAEWDRLEAAIQRSSPRHLPRVLPEILTLRQTQTRLLDEATLLLAYSLGAERSFLWVVDSQELQSYILPGRSEIEQLAASVSELFSKSHEPLAKAQFHAAATQLSTLLLGPIASRLDRQRLMILAEGALQVLPFAALPKPGGRHLDGGALLVDHRVAYLPSASLVAWLDRQHRDRAPAANTVAIFADPVFDARDQRLQRSNGTTSMAPQLDAAARDVGVNAFDHLPFTAREATAILELVPPAASFAALGFEASKERLLNTDLSSYRVIHIASHGILNPQHPELSGIVLSGIDPEGRPRDGFLRTFEVPDLRLAADLVVLSACRTAFGPSQRGESLQGLSRAFMKAGAHRVLVSLWNVDDEATATLMQRFYRHMLIENETPAEALRAAQLSMLREARWQAPYFWAGFLMQGKPS